MNDLIKRATEKIKQYPIIAKIANLALVVAGLAIAWQYPFATLLTAAIIIFFYA